MKYLASLVLSIAILFQGCALVNYIPDSVITAAITYGADAGFKFLQSQNRAEVADWVYYVAHLLRTSTALTPDQLGKAIYDSIPASIKTQFPGLVSYLIPKIVSVYKTYYDKYAGNNSKLVQILNDIAQGLENAASQYKTKLMLKIK
jgi:hypothetical protein